MNEKRKKSQKLKCFHFSPSSTHFHRFSTYLLMYFSAALTLYFTHSTTTNHSIMNSAFKLLWIIDERSRARERGGEWTVRWINWWKQKKREKEKWNKDMVLLLVSKCPTGFFFHFAIKYQLNLKTYFWNSLNWNWNKCVIRKCVTVICVIWMRILCIMF